MIVLDKSGKVENRISYLNSNPLPQTSKNLYNQKVMRLDYDMRFEANCRHKVGFDPP